MDLAKLSFTFSDGREIEVFESTWESSSMRTRIEEKARADKARLNGSGDPVFFFFLETFYSYLASCSRGSVPAAEEAYTLPDPDLDGWLLSVIEVNPESFVSVDRSRKGEVSFRDGSRLEIVSGYLPSVTMRRARLEEEALKREEDRNNPKDVFSVYLYPILAACSIGDLPSAGEIRSSWPEAEIYKWRDAIKEINPHWFGSTEETEARTMEEIRAVEKKSKQPRRRSPTS
jgi:hypothetical protein